MNQTLKNKAIITKLKKIIFNKRKPTKKGEFKILILFIFKLFERTDRHIMQILILRVYFFIIFMLI